VTLDALVVKCREGGRTVNVCVVHAVGVNRDGFRESLGLDVVTAEDGAAWIAYMRGLVARGLAGVKLVSSDAQSLRVFLCIGRWLGVVGDAVSEVDA
jgi:putative transposase